MDDNFSPRVKDVITYSKEEALRLGHDFIGTEHLMLGILRDGNGKAISILNNLSIDLEHLRRKVEILSPANPNAIVSNDKKNLHLTRQAERALKTTFLEAKVFQATSISTAHLLLCILRNENDPTTKLLNKLQIDYDIAKEQYLTMMPTNNEEDFQDNLPKNESSYGDDPGQDDSLKGDNFNNELINNKDQAHYRVIPNPVITTATIYFTPLKTGNTLIELFDLQGRSIKKIFSGRMNAGITQQVILNTDGLIDGSYFIKITSADKVKTLKIIVAR